MINFPRNLIYVVEINVGSFKIHEMHSKMEEMVICLVHRKVEAFKLAPRTESAIRRYNPLDGLLFGTSWDGPCRIEENCDCMVHLKIA